MRVRVARVSMNSSPSITYGFPSVHTELVSISSLTILISCPHASRITLPEKLPDRKLTESVTATGRSSPVGSTVTTMKMNMLSPLAITIFIFSVEASPSIFRRNGEASPPPSHIRSIRSGSFSRFMALSSRVADPAPEKTVSNDIVSEEKPIRPLTGPARGSQPMQAAVMSIRNTRCLISTC